MYYTELEYINLLINNVDIGVDYAITDHELSEFFNSKREDVPNEYKYIENELLAIRDLYTESIKWCRHSYYLYIVAYLTSIRNEGLIVPVEFFDYVKEHRVFFPTIDHLSNMLTMVYLPQRIDYIMMERDNRVISLARLYHRVGYNVCFIGKRGIINEHEKDFFYLIESYDCNGPFYVRSMIMGFYYMNYKKYNLTLDMLKRCLDNIIDFVDKMKINEMNYENINEEMILNYFQNSLNKMIIK